LNGNFLLNFGPKGDGSFRDEEKRLAAEIGDWMKTNGEAIYGCGYAELAKQDWGYYTRKKKTGQIYMVVCNVPVSGWLKVRVPRGKTGAGAALLDGGAPLKIEKFDSDEFFVILKEKSADRPFVITLDLE
jgi:alpha-L-fucosidase